MAQAGDLTYLMLAGHQRVAAHRPGDRCAEPGTAWVGNGPGAVQGVTGVRHRHPRRPHAVVDALFQGPVTDLVLRAGLAYVGNSYNGLRILD